MAKENRDMRLKTARGFELGTNLNSIEVPAELRVRVKTGITWIDEAFSGGLTPSTVGMITGMPGAGKSTLARQLADSLTRTCAEAIVVYNTGEESLFQVKMTCERMGITSDFRVGEETKCPKLITYLKKVQKEHPKKHVICLQDSLQTLDDAKYADGGTTGGTPVRVTEQLTNWAKETFGIALFVGQVTKNGTFAGRNTIKHAVDAHAELKFDEDKKSEWYGSLLFEVPKNRFGVSGMTYIVNITDKGLEMKDSFSRVGIHGGKPKGDEEGDDD